MSLIRAYDADIEADMNTDISAATDSHEAVSMMELLLISGGPGTGLR